MIFSKQPLITGKTAISVITTLFIALILVAVLPKTSLNSAGYALPTGWKLSITSSVPEGAVCDRPLTKAGFPLVTVRPSEDRGGCDDSVNRLAATSNALTALLVGTGLAIIAVKLLKRLRHD